MSSSDILSRSANNVPSKLLKKLKVIAASEEKGRLVEEKMEVEA